MQYHQTSSKSAQELIKALETSAVKHQFGVLNVRNMKETLFVKGFELEEECFILDICNPQIGHALLSEDLLLSSVLPCKISVFTQEKKTKVVMNSFVQLVDDINPDCLDFAQEAQKTLQAIIDEAI